MAMATDAVKTVRQLMVARDVGELVGVVVVTDLGLSKERSSRNVCPFWRIFRPQLHSWRSKLDVEFEAIGLDAADVIFVLHLLGCLLLLGNLSPTDVHGPGSIARKRPSSRNVLILLSLTPRFFWPARFQHHLFPQGLHWMKD